MMPRMAPATYVSDRWFELPKISSDRYIDQLLNICKENGIGMIVPTIDTELMVLAQEKVKFGNEGISVIVSDPEFVMTCRD